MAITPKTSLDIFNGINDINNYLKPTNGKRFALVRNCCGLLELWDKEFMQFDSIMSNSKHEKEFNLEVVEKARGDILIAGLGLGMIVLPIMNKPEVISVDVIELHEEIIDLIASQLPLNGKVKMINENAFQFKIDKKYDIIYFDTIERGTSRDSIAKELYKQNLKMDGEILTFKR